MYVDAVWTLSPVSFRVLVQFAFSFPLLLEFMKNVHRNNNKSRGPRAFVTFKNALLIDFEHDRNIRGICSYTDHSIAHLFRTFIAKHRPPKILHWILSDVCWKIRRDIRCSEFNLFNLHWYRFCNAAS